jgi:hypothetical protein
LSYKIQSKTILGWLDLIGGFPTIKEATELIPKMESLIIDPYPLSDLCILRIVDSKEKGINDSFVYDLDSI